MTIIGWAEIALILALTFVLAVPLGRYMAAVVQGDRTLLSPVLGPVEQGFYRLSGVDAGRGMDWKQYAFALVALQAVHFLLLYLMLRFQQYLPLNPMAQGPMSPRLAFNTAISFVTNTNWQAYGGETALSYGTQMWGLTVHNFLSAATGIAAAVMVARAFVAGGVRQLGNFWVDMTRIVLYILLPIAIVYGLFLLWQGVPDTLAASAIATTLEGGKQTIALGPVAFQEAIKMVGTNGGGFFNANSAHPFENPTALSNVVETISEIVIPFGLAITFGVIVKDRRQGRALFWVMAALLIPLAAGIYAAEGAGNPLLTHIGVSAAQGNMEGKEVRFGTAMSSLFAATTTGTSDGAVIAMHDSFTPLGGGIPIFLMELGEVAPGGVGSGLYAMIVFALLAVFVAGLMVGRTPEYLGKKVQAREIKLAMLAVLILPLCMLVGAAWSLNTATGTGSLANSGPHGLSEMLYAWTSATANNGSAFAGLSADTPLLDYGLGAAMLLGRFAYLVPVLAIAGSLAIKPKVPDNAGTFPTHGPLFIGLMLGVVLILGGLQFLPALSLGPLAEHFAMLAGKTY